MGIMEKLGLKRVSKLTKKTCKDRVAHLKRGIKKGTYRGKLLGYAKYYASWYAWLERQGGTRAIKKPKKITKKQAPKTPALAEA